MAIEFLTEIIITRIRLGLYCALCFFSFMIIIGVAKLKDDAGGCPLYADVSRGRVTYYSSGCNFAFVISIVNGLFYSVARIVTLVIFIIGRITADNPMFSSALQRCYVGFEAVSCFFMFVCACVLSAGINSVLNDLPKGYDLYGRSAGSAAEAGAWIGTFVYVATIVFGVLYLIRTDNMPFYSKRHSEDGVYTVSGQAGGAVVMGPGQDAAEAPPAYEDALRKDTTPY